MLSSKRWIISSEKGTYFRKENAISEQINFDIFFDGNLFRLKNRQFDFRIC